MAKRKTKGHQALKAITQDDLSRPTPPEAPVAVAPAESMLVAAGPEVRTLAVPVELTDNYATRRLDIRLSPAHAETLRAVQDGLNRSNARLRDGKHVESSRHAVLWILENIGGA